MFAVILIMFGFFVRCTLNFARSKAARERHSIQTLCQFSGVWAKIVGKVRQKLYQIENRQFYGGLIANSLYINPIVTIT
jgi:hypothetical protein